MGNVLGSERGKGPDLPSEIPPLFLKPLSRTKALLIHEGQRGKGGPRSASGALHFSRLPAHPKPL
eukprot:704084-Pyramimonas_sp.AAC.1